MTKMLTFFGCLLLICSCHRYKYLENTDQFSINITTNKQVLTENDTLVVEAVFKNQTGKNIYLPLFIYP